MLEIWRGSTTLPSSSEDARPVWLWLGFGGDWRPRKDAGVSARARERGSPKGRMGMSDAREAGMRDAGCEGSAFPSELSFFVPERTKEKSRTKPNDRSPFITVSCQAPSQYGVWRGGRDRTRGQKEGLDADSGKERTRPSVQVFAFDGGGATGPTRTAQARQPERAGAQNLAAAE